MRYLAKAGQLVLASIVIIGVLAFTLRSFEFVLLVTGAIAGCVVCLAIGRDINGFIMGLAVGSPAVAYTVLLGAFALGEPLQSSLPSNIGTGIAFFVGALITSLISGFTVGFTGAAVRRISTMETRCRNQDVVHDRTASSSRDKLL